MKRAGECDWKPRLHRTCAAWSEHGFRNDVWIEGDHPGFFESSNDIFLTQHLKMCFRIDCEKVLFRNFSPSFPFEVVTEFASGALQDTENDNIQSLVEVCRV